MQAKQKALAEATAFNCLLFRTTKVPRWEIMLFIIDLHVTAYETKAAWECSGIKESKLGQISKKSPTKKTHYGWMLCCDWLPSEVPIRSSESRPIRPPATKREKTMDDSMWIFCSPQAGRWTVTSDACLPAQNSKLHIRCYWFNKQICLQCKYSER